MWVSISHCPPLLLSRARNGCGGMWRPCSVFMGILRFAGGKRTNYSCSRATSAAAIAAHSRRQLSHGMTPLASQPRVCSGTQEPRTICSATIRNLVCGGVCHPSPAPYFQKHPAKLVAPSPGVGRTAVPSSPCRRGIQAQLWRSRTGWQPETETAAAVGPQQTDPYSPLLRRTSSLQLLQRPLLPSQA